MGKVSVLVSFDEGVLDRVDAARGQVPRVAWIRGVVERALSPGGVVTAGQVDAALGRIAEGPEAIAEVPVKPRVPLPRRAVKAPASGGMSKAEEDGISSAILQAVHRQRYSIKGLSVLLGQDEAVVEKLVRAMETAGLVKRVDGLVGRGVK